MLILDPFWNWITSGSPYTGILKREFCRPCKPGEWEVWNAEGEIQRITYWTGAVSVSVDQIYPVEPKVQQPPVGWIRVRSIRRDCVRHITREEAHAQGFRSVRQFRSYYAKHYGVAASDNCYVFWIEPLFLSQLEEWRHPSRS